MLLHVTMTHTADNCPGYTPEKMPEFAAALEKSFQLAEELNVKIHFMVNAAPAHEVYALLETDDQSSLLKLLHSVPLRQEFKITPVIHQKDLIEAAKQMGKK